MALTSAHVAQNSTRRLSVLMAWISVIVLSLAGAALLAEAVLWVPMAVLGAASGLLLKAIFFNTWLRVGVLVDLGILWAPWPPTENRMELPIFESVLQGINVVGSIVGTRRDLAETFELHGDGKTRAPTRLAVWRTLTRRSGTSRAVTLPSVSYSSSELAPRWVGDPLSPQESMLQRGRSARTIGAIWT
jgi:hypothetical protein